MDVGGGDHPASEAEIPGRAGVVDDGAPEPEIGRRADGRVNAHAGHHPAQHELLGAAVAQPPLEVGADMPFTIIGRDTASRSGVGQARYIAVSGEYFEALGISLESGRRLTDRDREGGELVVVINEAARRQLWPDEDPLNQQIHLGLPSIAALADPAPRRIVVCNAT